MGRGHPLVQTGHGSQTLRSPLLSLFQPGTRVRTQARLGAGKTVLRAGICHGPALHCRASRDSTVAGGVQLKASLPVLCVQQLFTAKIPGDAKKKLYPRETRSATHFPASIVPSVPPRSGVVLFSRTAASTADSILSAASLNPRWFSIMAAVRIAPKGLAMFFPAMGGAEPCTGSNMDVFPG